MSQSLRGLMTTLLARLAMAFTGCVSGGAGAAGQIDARLISVAGTGESAPAAIATLRFHNRSAEGAIDVQSYRLDWPGGSRTVEAEGLRVPAGADVDRTTRVEARHGDVAALLARASEPRLVILRARLRPGRP